MVNSYHKLLNNRIEVSYRDKFIAGLHQELKRNISMENEDIYSMVNDLTNKSSKIDINLLLKYCMLTQLLDTKFEHNQTKYKDTNNPSIKQDSEGRYYKIKNDEVVPAKNIVKINDDGSYIVHEKQAVNSYIIQKIYNISEQIMSLRLVDRSGNVVADKNTAAEMLGLKREFKKKYKYAGYSGNSRDVVASICNMFSSPIETGYYMDFRCVFYKWHAKTSSFVRVFEREKDSPLLVDIEFCSNGTVLRQEYTGTFNKQ